MEKEFHANTNHGKGREVLSLIQSKLKEHYQRQRKKFYMVEGLAHKADKIKNVYASHNRDSKYIKLKWAELEGKINKSIITVEDVNTPLSQKLKEIDPKNQ